MSTINTNVVKQKKEAQDDNDWDMDWPEHLAYYAAERRARIKKECLVKPVIADNQKVVEGLFRYTVKDRYETFLTIETPRDIKTFFPRKQK